MRDPDMSSKWSSLSALLRRPWFSRRWVVQDIAFAVQATVHCGNHVLTWASLAQAVSMFLTYRTSFSLPPAGIADVFQLEHGARLIEITSSAIIKDDNGRSLRRVFSLETLVTVFSYSQTSVPHNSVYALLPLSKDVEPAHELREEASRTSGYTVHVPLSRSPSTFPRDYSKPYIEACQDFIQHSISQSGSLDIICRSWAPEVPNLPFWVSTVSAGFTL